MITNEDEIKRSADIVKIIGNEIELKRKGANYQACCPFHEEKTPSFSVSETKGIYKCFGCGKAGDAVKFIMEYRSLVYPLALEYVAQQCGIDIQYSDDDNREQFLKEVKEIQKKKKGTLATLNEAYALYEEQSSLELNTNEDTILLYQDKYYQKETIQQFRITQAPKESILSTFGNEEQRSHLRDTGWILPSTHSTENAQSWYDLFRGRLLFPILDFDKNVVGISGRDLTGENKAKYINSKESDVFEKRSLLYGLPQAHRSIRKKGYALLVEGQTDVVGLHDNGIINAVAPLGTSLTAEQAKILAKYTEVVYVCYDGDALEKDVIQKAVELLLSEQVHCRVIELPKEEDPDSFIRKNGKKEWESLEEFQNKDGLEWCVLKMPRMTNYHVESALKYAVRLISLVQSSRQREMYCKEIAGILKLKVSDVLSDVKERIDLQDSNKNALTPLQEKDAATFGIYIDKNRFYKSNNSKTGYALSNFVIDPIMLIKGAETSERLVEIRNHKTNEIVSIDSDDFVALGSFRKKTESKGNYLFYGKEEDYMRVKEYIYSRFPTCYPINTMGLHKRGFFTWGNGLTTPEGDFVPVNRFGVCEYDDRKYYLSTFSEIKLNIEDDGAAIEDDPGEYYVLKPDKDCPSFSEWSDVFIKVFGNNGMIAICWYIATLYRDIIMKKLKFFPHLDLFGPPGSGKTFMGWRMAALFGEQRDPAPLPTTSIAGMTRLVTQFRNGFIWFDEYTAYLKPEQVEMLKNIPDGFGRRLGKKSNNNKTTKTPVNCATLISGQVLPNQDPALMNRCITLFFKVIKTTPEQEKYANMITRWEDGRLSHLTAKLHTLRPLISSKIGETLAEVREELKSKCAVKPDDRMANAYSIVLSVAKILRDELELAFTINRLTSFIVESMESQADILQGSEEISGFWSIIANMIERGIMDRRHIVIQKVHHVKKMEKDDSSTQIDFDYPKVVVFMIYDAAFGLYREHGKKQGEGRLFGKKDLEYYLSTHVSYIGKCKAKSFYDDETTSRARRCLMFYEEFLPIDLETNQYDSKDKPKGVSADPEPANDPYRQSSLEFNQPTDSNDPF